jgi:hydroxymethylpyrimidine/phosphomethylpyrimidine kinase
LTIAGSDSGGGAGIQADLKTFTALGVFGTSAITCITTQNPDRVTGIQPVEPGMVARQMGAVCEGFPVAAAKTGMLYSAEIIEAVAEGARERGLAPLVVDPVMVATSGARLLREDAVAALCTRLFPVAVLITPNILEAEILQGGAIQSRQEQEAAARHLAAKFGIACVVKGGHLPGDEIVDVLCVRGELQVFTAPRVRTAETHGTGCTFSAAVAALLAQGRSLEAAVQGAQEFVVRALRAAVPVGTHCPLGIASAAAPPAAEDARRASP